MQDTSLSGHPDPTGHSNHAQARRFAGRKKKKKLTTMQDKVADAALLLKDKIAKAHFATSQSHGPSSIINEERRSSSPASTSGTTGSQNRRPSTMSMLGEDSGTATKSEIIENYFKSQSELKSQMERQYLDRLARNDFVDEVSSSPSLTNNEDTRDSVMTYGDSDGITDVTDASVLKSSPAPTSISGRENGRANLKRKRTSSSSKPVVREPSPDPESSVGPESFPSAAQIRLSDPNRDEVELEILSKLPPIDPALRAEFSDFAFDPDPEPDQGVSGTEPSYSAYNFNYNHTGPSPTFNNVTNTIETDPFSHEPSTEPVRKWTLEPKETPVSLPPPIEIGKINWGSDTEDESDVDEPMEEAVKPVELGLPSPSSSAAAAAAVAFHTQQSDTTLPETAETPPVSSSTAVEPEPEEVYILRTIDESEVDRLHDVNVANLNGNFDKSGCFREWHETLTVQSYGGDDLLILPYTVIDF